MESQPGKPTIRQLIESHGTRFGVTDHLPKFLFVGFLGIFVDVISFLLIRRFILPDILSAQVFSFVVAVTNNFIWNKYWTFRKREARETSVQYFKFLVVALCALGLRSGVVALCVQYGLPALICLLVGIGSGTAVNFIGSREWAFAGDRKFGYRTAANSDFLVSAFIVFLFIVRIVYSARLDLSPEEAYYWNYSIHPALSYFDHPPMVAWVIWLGTVILGKTELGVRIVGILLNCGSTLLIYALGKMWFGKRSGLIAALLFSVIPIYFIYGFTITPDTPLMFFWLITMYSISIALVRGKNWGWYTAGIALGCSMLSKYTGVFLVPGTALFLLLNREYRKWFLRKEPYLALIISLLFVSPVILWNYQHDWASFSFQFSQRLSKTTSHPLLYFLRFVGSQMGVVFPTFFLGLMLVLVISLRKSLRGVDPKWKYALSHALPLLAFLIYYSTKSEVKVNWSVPAYLSLLLATYPCYRYLRRLAKGQVKGFIRGATSVSIYIMPLMFLSVLYHLSIGIPFLPPIAKLGGWKELGAAIKQEEAAMQEETGRDPFLVGMSKYHLAAEMAFYSHEPYDTFSSDVVGGPGLGFEYWTTRSALQGRDAIILFRGMPNLEFLRSFFAKVDEKIRPVPIPRQGKASNPYYVVRCYSYHG